MVYYCLVDYGLFVLVVRFGVMLLLFGRVWLVCLFVLGSVVLCLVLVCLLCGCFRLLVFCLIVISCFDWLVSCCYCERCGCLLIDWVCVSEIFG